MEKVLVAMSGGVDSSAAALLMQEKGYDCIGITMKLFNNSTVDIPREHSCCSLDDIEDARAVAFHLNMPYYVLNFTDNFEEKVIKPFVDSYICGETPNPCIECNRYLKFEKLFQRAKELDCRYVVTGHYSRIEYDEDRKIYLLKKALDDTKDQSYVLYFLSQEQLSKIYLPLGNLRKTDVRDIAQKHDFINFNKPDSQDICFVQNGKYSDFIESYTEKKSECGDFVDTDGNVLGTHKGIIRYTIGQRKGLGISSKEPLYVCDKDVDKNIVTLGTSEHLMTSRVVVKNCNFITENNFEKPDRIKVKLRYRQKEQPCVAKNIGDNRVELVFDNPQRAVTKGQAAVFYDGDIVLGGGVIEYSE